MASLGVTSLVSAKLTVTHALPTSLPFYYLTNREAWESNPSIDHSLLFLTWFY